MAKDKLLTAEELVSQSEGLTAEELVSGKVNINTKKKKNTSNVIGNKLKSSIGKPIQSISPKESRGIKSRRESLTRLPKIDVTYTREQAMLRGMFGGNFGKNILLMPHERMPQLNRTIISGGGIIKSGDVNSETAGLFGIRGRR